MIGREEIMTMRTNLRSVVLALAILGAAAASPAFAQDTHFKLYGGAAYVAPTSDSNVTLGTITDALKAEKRVGWNFGVEGRITKWIGVELDYVRATQDVKFGGQTIGQTDFSPLTASLNIHVVHTKIVDLYLGPSYSYVNWGTIQLNAAGEGLLSTVGLGTESSRCWGAGLGLDIGIGKHFALTGGLRYLDTDLDIQGGQSVAVKPVVGRLGVAVRF
jgi:outer membrane protein W